MAASFDAAFAEIEGEELDRAIGLSRPPHRHAPTPEPVEGTFRRLSQDQLNRLVRALIRQHGCQPADAEEAVHNAFARLLEQEEEIFVGDPNDWLPRIAVEARNQLRRLPSKRRRVEAIERLQELAGDSALGDVEPCVAPSLADNRRREEIGWLDGHAEWSAERIVEMLQRFRDRHGRPPRSDECRRINRLPSLTTICRRFGSLRAAILAAGMVPHDLGRRTARWEPLEAALACRWFRRRNWRWPDHTDVRRNPDILPGLQAMRRYFGGTSAFQVGRGTEAILAGLA